MLTPDQEPLARAAFEANKKAIYASVAASMCRSGQVRFVDEFENPKKFDRRSDGHYADVSLRVDWARWCSAWASCLEANKSQRALVDMLKDPGMQQYSRDIQRVGRLDDGVAASEEDRSAAQRILAFWGANPAAALAFPATGISVSKVHRIAGVTP